MWAQGEDASKGLGGRAAWWAQGGWVGYDKKPLPPLDGKMKAWMDVESRKEMVQMVSCVMVAACPPGMVLVAL